MNDLDPDPLTALFIVPAVGFLGLIAGYIAGAIAEFIAPRQELDLLRWAQIGSIWAGVFAVAAIATRWLGLD